MLGDITYRLLKIANYNTTIITQQKKSGLTLFMARSMLVCYALVCGKVSQKQILCLRYNIWYILLKVNGSDMTKMASMRKFVLNDK